MRVFDIITNLNNRTEKVSDDSYLYVKQYYLSMYRYYMLVMYEKGYIIDPTIYNEKIIRQNIVELNIKGLYTTLGNMIINPERVKYALFKNKGKEEQDFLTCLYNVLLYREYSRSVDFFYEAFGSSRNLKLRLKENLVKSKADVPLNKANLRVLVNKDETVRVVSLNKYKLSLIFELLGVDAEDYSIDKDLSCNDLCEVLDVVFGDDPPTCLDGKYSDVIFNWFNNYNRPILSHVSSHFSLRLLDKLSEVVEEVKDNLVCLYGTDVYVKDKIHTKKYPLGFFGIIGGFDGDHCFTEEKVNGYTGEAYTLEYLREEGYSCIGVPILVGNEYVFDREQTNISSNSWFSQEENIDFVFESKTISSINNEEDAIQSSREGTLGVLRI